ncbi:MAG: DUF4040 domain-containing protein [Deltaproteobacteria bacterium]|jgi:energy-converting hydrogenase B subunit D|nr:DUF4040 domain-containing protein [Deltaproteobacteria bacterium]
MILYQIIVLVLVLVMIAGAVAVVTAPTNFSAVIMEGVVALTLALLFLLMAAPDVAITQTVIAAGLSTAIFLWTLRRLEKVERKEKNHE